MVALLLSCLGAVQVGAGAWSQRPGHCFARLSGVFYESDEFYNETGKRTPAGMNNESFDAGQVFLYLECGLRDRLTLIGKLAMGRLVAEDDFMKQATTGIGDLEAGIKYQLIDRPLVVAPLVMIKMPTGYDESDPAMGTGYRDFEMRLLAARSFYPAPVYVGAEAGFRFRDGPYSNQLPLFAEVGATPHPRLFAKIYAEGTNTLTAREETTGEVGGLQVSEGDFVKAGLNLAFQVGGPLWADVLWERIVDGENVGAGGSWGLGLVYTY